MTLENIIFVILGILLGAFLGFFIGKIIKYKELKLERSASIKKSKSVILGEVYEKVLPFLPNFPYKPRDMVFLGKGVDYIIFDGMSEGDLKKIIFLEVKSGSSTLNKNEKMIRDTLLKKQVEYTEYRI